MDQPLPTTDIGYCDPDGVVHCNLCDWSRRCSSVEEVEFRFVEHVASAHRVRTVLRRNPTTGEATELTDPEE